MRASLKNIWLSRFVTFGLAAVAAGSAVFWGLQGAGLAFVTPTVAVDVQSTAVFDANAVTRALGGAGAGLPVAPNAPASVLDASRFALTGVVASSSQRGAALISVGGKPAKPYAVGAQVGDGWMLQSVQVRRAVLVKGSGAEEQALPGALQMVLELPALTKK